ncbi:MAG: hypothetical protein RIB67_01050 [Miltoncostaeaceae bacterium]
MSVWHQVGRQPVAVAALVVALGGSSYAAVDRGRPVGALRAPTVTDRA